MIEVFGDSARGEEFALVRLAVDGERIVEADAPGLARPLAGLTLLEAAAVRGRPWPRTRSRTRSRRSSAPRLPAVAPRSR